MGSSPADHAFGCVGHVTQVTHSANDSGDFVMTPRRSGFFQDGGMRPSYIGFPRPDCNPEPAMQHDRHLILYREGGNCRIRLFARSESILGP